MRRNYSNYLNEFQEIYGISNATIARAIGATNQAVSHWRVGRHTPSQPFRDRLNRFTSPVVEYDIPKLLKITQMLKEEDTSLNVYELYKHPEARAKLFAQITEACYLALGETPQQVPRLIFCQYLEGQFNKIIKKLADSTDKQKMAELIDRLELPEEQQEQFIRDVVATGLLSEGGTP